MSREMGPCPKCRRHVVIADHKCPFCGAAWLMSAAAAASLLFGTAEAAPVPDAPMTAVEQEQEYGVPRPPVDRKLSDWAWAVLYGDWKAQYGFSPATSSWRNVKAGQGVVLAVQDGGRAHHMTVRVDRADEKQAALSVEIDDYRIAAKLVALRPAIPEEATVTKAGSGTVEVDGKNTECTITRYEWPGMDVRVWRAGERILRVETAQEKCRFVRTEDLGKRRCEVWETVRGEEKILEWRSAEVPGGIVRIESGGRKIELVK